MGDKQLSGEERHTQSKSNEASGSDKRKYKKSTPSTSEASESQGSTPRIEQPLTPRSESSEYISSPRRSKSSHELIRGALGKKIEPNHSEESDREDNIDKKTSKRLSVGVPRSRSPIGSKRHGSTSPSSPSRDESPSRRMLSNNSKGKSKKPSRDDLTQVAPLSVYKPNTTIQPLSVYKPDDKKVAPLSVYKPEEEKHTIAPLSVFKPEDTKIKPLSVFRSHVEGSLAPLSVYKHEDEKKKKDKPKKDKKDKEKQPPKEYEAVAPLSVFTPSKGVGPLSVYKAADTEKSKQIALLSVNSKGGADESTESSSGARPAQHVSNSSKRDRGASHSDDRAKSAGHIRPNEQHTRQRSRSGGAGPDREIDAEASTDIATSSATPNTSPSPVKRRPKKTS